MATKRSEQERFEEVLTNESLQGAQEAVANEVAAAEPEIPSLLTEPPLEAKRVTVIKFEKSSRPSMPALPVLPTQPDGLASQAKIRRLPPPVFGGAAHRVSVAPASAEAELSPPWPSQLPTLDLEMEESLNENTPNLYAVEAEAFEAPAQPWTLVARTPLASSSLTLKKEEPQSRPQSRWVVWSIAAVLSVCVLGWAWWMPKRQPKPSTGVIVQLEPPLAPGAPLKNSVPPPPHVEPPVSMTTRLAMGPSENANATPTSAKLVEQVEPLVEKSNAATRVAWRSKAEPASSDKRISEGLEAARKHVQKDKFDLALTELNKIEPLLKKYPARPLDFDFLHGVSLAFTAENARQASKAWQKLKPLRDSYKAEPEYWHAIGWANQVLGDEARYSTSVRCKHWQQAKWAYTETLRLGKNNRKYMDARSYIENKIDVELQRLACADIGD
ncbi:MAG: hypothetical protein FWD46_05470 [Cystobacterineae bacterium]|nr:hypothetical protein [Cystobacterineae bacterium]